MVSEKSFFIVTYIVDCWTCKPWKVDMQLSQESNPSVGLHLQSAHGMGSCPGMEKVWTEEGGGHAEEQGAREEGGGVDSCIDSFGGIYAPAKWIYPIS